MTPNIYTMLSDLIGTPPNEMAEYALYLGCVVIVLFVLWSFTSILLHLFRGAWDRL